MYSQQGIRLLEGKGLEPYTPGNVQTPLLYGLSPPGEFPLVVSSSADVGERLSLSPALVFSLMYSAAFIRPKPISTRRPVH